MDIQELIDDNEEGTFLDFKREEYRAEIKCDLIKDVLAFANASYEHERYIIIGIKKHHTGISVFPVEKPEDSAAIQQYIHENITPELNVSYEPFNYQGHNLMVLKISDTTEQPYFAVKQIDRGGRPFIRKGELWVRKGSRNVLGERADYERIYNRRQTKNGLEGNIALNFQNGTAELEVPVLGKYELPSVSNRREIEEQIAYKKELLLTDSAAYQRQFDGYYPGGGSTSYQAMSLPALYKAEETVGRNFADEDQYHIHERLSFKLQLVISNNGDKHLEKAMVSLSIPVMEGLTVADHIYLNTRQQSIALGIDHQAGYPKVGKDGQSITVNADIGEIRHQIPAEVFEKPLRIVAMPDLAGQAVEISATVYGSNLGKPQTFKLLMRFV